MTDIALLRHREHILLDFDGPVCRMFADLSAASIAADMLRLLNSRGVSAPEELHRSPHELFHYVGTRHESVRAELDALLTEREIEAAKLAEPTPGAHELLQRWRLQQRPVAIVSNNAAAAIRTYLAEHRLAELPFPIIGRPTDPTLMKPAPDMLEHGMAALGATAEGTVMIGDSASDVTAAAAAGIPIVAFANKPGKAETFREHGASEVITDMAALSPG